ncbi:MAG: hypothetical protein ACJ76I_13450 [Gaiellaceae bacterium]
MANEELVTSLRSLHKALLDAERKNVERIHGPMTNTEFFQLVSDKLRYGWLQPLNDLVLAADDGEDVSDRARELLRPPDSSTPFGRRLIALMQTDPTLVLAQGRVAKLL